MLLLLQTYGPNDLWKVMEIEKGESRPTKKKKN